MLSQGYGPAELLVNSVVTVLVVYIYTYTHNFLEISMNVNLGKSTCISYKFILSTSCILRGGLWVKISNFIQTFYPRCQ